jgi:hypothetical protein
LLFKGHEIVKEYFFIILLILYLLLYLLKRTCLFYTVVQLVQFLVQLFVLGYQRVEIGADVEFLGQLGQRFVERVSLLAELTEVTDLVVGEGALARFGGFWGEV